jgi:hypothetical protein
VARTLPFQGGEAGSKPVRATSINSSIQLRIENQKEAKMKTIVTIAAIAALTTLTACGDASAPAPVDTTDTEVVEAPAENTGGPCGDGTVLRDNEVCP